MVHRCRPDESGGLRERAVTPCVSPACACRRAGTVNPIFFTTVKNGSILYLNKRILERIQRQLRAGGAPGEPVPWDPGDPVQRGMASAALNSVPEQSDDPAGVWAPLSHLSHCLHFAAT